MSANGGNAILTRMGVAAVTGTAGNVAAQGLVEHRVDLAQAAEFGVGMAALGAAGETGKHLLGQHGGAAPAAFSRSGLDAAPYEAGEAPAADVPVIGSGEQAGQGGVPAPDVPAADVPVAPAAYGHEGAAVGDPATTTLAADQAPAVGGDAVPGGQGQGPSPGGTGIGRIRTRSSSCRPPTGPATPCPFRPWPSTVREASPRRASLRRAPGHPARRQRLGTPVRPPRRDPGRTGRARPERLRTREPGSRAARLRAGHRRDVPRGREVGDPVSPVARASAAPTLRPRTVSASRPRIWPGADRPPVVLAAGGPETLLRPAPVEVPMTPGDAGRAQPGVTAPHGAPGMTAPRVVHPAAETGPGTRTDAPGLDSGSRTPVAREATPPRSLDLNPDTRTPLIPDTVTAGEAPHASEWAHLRESATAVPLQREIHPFTDASRVEVRRITLTGEGGDPANGDRVHGQAPPPGRSGDDARGHVVRAKSSILGRGRRAFNV